MPDISPRLPLQPGNIAVVTGAAKRLGREISLVLAQQLELDIVVHYGQSHEAAEQVRSEIQACGRRATTVSADLLQPETAASKIFTAAAGLGSVRVLINCAAVFEDRDLADIDAEHWRQQFTVNALAPLMLTREFSKQLPAEQSGHVVNILDWRATRPPATHAVYTASKAALASLTRSLAQQLAPAIQVHAIAPGAMLPPPGEDDWHIERAVSTIPLQRPGQPSDVCDAIVFLLTSGFMTGEILHVSGGEEL